MNRPGGNGTSANHPRSKRTSTTRTGTSGPAGNSWWASRWSSPRPARDASPGRPEGRAGRRQPSMRRTKSPTAVRISSAVHSSAGEATVTSVIATPGGPAEAGSNHLPNSVVRVSSA